MRPGEKRQAQRLYMKSIASVGLVDRGACQSCDIVITKREEAMCIPPKDIPAALAQWSGDVQAAVKAEPVQAVAVGAAFAKRADLGTRLDAICDAIDAAGGSGHADVQKAEGEVARIARQFRDRDPTITEQHARGLAYQYNPQLLAAALPPTYDSPTAPAVKKSLDDTIGVLQRLYAPVDPRTSGPDLLGGLHEVRKRHPRAFALWAA